MIGAALFLIPGKLNIPYVIESGLIFAMLGILSFSAALSLLIVSILSTSRKRAIFVKVSALALLFIFSVVYWQAGNYLEGVVLAFTGLMLLVLLTPFSVYLSQINLLNLVFVLIGFTNGIILAVSNAQYAQYDLVNYKTFLVIGFLVTALAGAIVTIVPSIKYGSILTRLQIIPWLGWCFIFMPVVPLATLIIPFLVVVAILMNGILPWEYLKLSKEDVLGRRTIMITATLELVVLLFIGAILLLLDNALNENFISISTLRDISFLFFSTITVIVYYEVFNILITINGLLAELKNTEVVVGNSQHFNLGNWEERISLYLKPFILTQELVRNRHNAQADQNDALPHQLGNEKKRNAQLILLLELSQQLENQLDQPVAAQLAVNTLERAVDCSLASIYVHESEKREFMLLAAAGSQTSLVPTGYRQSVTVGVIGRAIRQRKTQIINDIREDADYIRFENENNLSALIIPLIFNGHANGAIVLSSEKLSAFGSIDIGLAEAVGGSARGTTIG